MAGLQVWGGLLLNKTKSVQWMLGYAECCSMGLLHFFFTLYFLKHHMRKINRHIAKLFIIRTEWKDRVGNKERTKVPYSQPPCDCFHYLLSFLMQIFRHTEGDYYDPTRSISFILLGLLARMSKPRINQNGSFVFIQFHAHHWWLSLIFYQSSDNLDWIHHSDNKFA